MKAKDITIIQTEHIKPTDKLESAVGIMFSGNTNLIAVCIGKKLLGTITKSDILEFIVKTADLKKSKNSPLDWENIHNSIPDLTTISVNQVMNRKTVAVHEEDDVSKVLSVMKSEKVDKIPVIDEEKRFIGLITKENVLRSLIDKNDLFPESHSNFDFYSSANENTDWNDRLKFEIPDLKRFLNSSNVKNILDIGSGSGEHSIALSKLGFNVVGVERNLELFNIAIKNSKKMTSKGSGRLKFVNKQIDDYLFDLDSKFDAILFMGNSISYNPTTYRYLIKRAAEILNKKGIIVFQIANFEKALTTRRRLINFDVISPKEDKTRNFAFLEFLDEPFRGRLINKNTISILSENHQWQWAGTSSYTMVYLDEERIIKLLEKEGFDNIESYGGRFDGRHWDYLFRKPFQPLISDWLNIVATKK